MAQGWLKDLEEKVRETSDALRALRQENEELKATVSELEQRLETAQSDDKSEAWQTERDEIRERVETLAQHLTDLLGEG